MAANDSEFSTNDERAVHEFGNDGDDDTRMAQTAGNIVYDGQKLWQRNICLRVMCSKRQIDAWKL